MAAVRPELQQYDDLKEKHPDVLLLFRNGGNYEAYQDDVPTIEKTLGLEKTEYGSQQEGSSVFKVSFPTNMLDVYLPKLIRSGSRVAICDAVESMSENRKAGMSLPNKPAGEAENMERHTGLRM